ncbi:MAG: Lrp/AsnC family transcriptional regulator, partial [Candidatus Micrarchaeota archaeon]|nr:Lrp/AsnC family transcriptional regulator [Candidatus Micrarchaeota archaeon]
MELDPLDRKVLYNVDLGSRAGLKGLARQCRTSPEVVRYRLARLEKEGAIRKHMALVNISSLGYVAHGVYCNYAGKDELEGIREFFLSHPNCHWAADFGGKYDFVFGLLAKDTFEFYRMLNGIKERMRGKLSGFDVAIRIRVDQYPRDY